MNRLRQIIYNNINPWTEQSPDRSIDEIFSRICRDLDSGRSFACEDSGFVVMFNPENRYTCKIHIFSEAKGYTIVPSLKRIIEYMFDNTQMQKFYGMVSNKKIGSLARKAHWTYHGELTESIMCPDGVMRSQYIYGISRNDYTRIKSEGKYF